MASADSGPLRHKMPMAPPKRPSKAVSHPDLGLSTNVDTSAGAEEDESEDGSDADDEEADSPVKMRRSAPSRASNGEDTCKSAVQSTMRLMGPKKSGADHDEEIMLDAVDEIDEIDEKIWDLEASGWRPDEETFGADDDDYNDVDLISEADVTDKNMRLQESFMYQAEEEDALAARRLSLNSDASDEAAFDFGEGLMLTEPSFSNSFYPLDVSFGDDIAGDITPSAIKSVEDSTTAQRRVRFEDEIDGSDVASTDDEQVNDIFPDLFVQQDHLTSTFRGMIEDDDAFLDNGSDAGSCWDFEGDDTTIHLEEDDESESSGSSNDSDSDDGDTTDEEMPPHPSTVPRPALVEASPTSSSSSTNTVTNAQKLLRKTIKRRGSSPCKLPKTGTFVLDPHRPVLLVDGAGKSQRSQFYPAKIQTEADKQFWQKFLLMQNRKKAQRDLSRQLLLAEENGLDISQVLDSNTPNEIFDGLGSLRADQIIGPPEAFTPFTSIDANSGVAEDDTWRSVEEDEGTDFMDFFNFDDSDEDDDEDMPDESDALESPSTTRSSSFPHFSSSKSGGNVDLLAHFDRQSGLVGSFRRNQQYAKQAGSLPSHPSLRAMTSESNAMQTGRRAAGNAPITPLRKKRGGKNVGMRSSPMPTMSPVPKSATKRKGPARGGFSGRR